MARPVSSATVKGASGEEFQERGVYIRHVRPTSGLFKVVYQVDKASVRFLFGISPPVMALHLEKLRSGWEVIRGWSHGTDLGALATR